MNSEALVPVSQTEVVVDLFPQVEKSRRRLITAGLLVIGLGFGGLGLWAAFAPLTSAALAPGVVKVASERKTVQHLEGGTVKEIVVAEDQEVAAGDVLVRLDDTVPKARHSLLQGQHDVLSAEIARLEAEREGLPRISFPPSLLERKADPRVADLMRGEELLFDSRRSALNGQVRVLAQRKQQLHEKISGRQTQVEATRVKRDYITEEIKGADELMKVGMYLKPRYFALKRNEAELDGEVGRLRSEIAESRELIGETDMRIMDIRNQALKEINDRLQELRAKHYDTGERLSAAAESLARTQIRAPHAGTVLGLQVHTIGGVIKPGETILDIVPKDDKLIVEAKVRPDDIDVVHKGLPAEIRFTALNWRTTPILPGTVTRISADRFTDAKTGLPYYLAQVEVDPRKMPKLTLQPGMPAEVFIITGERTTLDYLLKPIRDQLHRGMLEE
jgi:HlyD family type I secretion membrane fusion protein